jgi:hypothetical protein
METSGLILMFPSAYPDTNNLVHISHPNIILPFIPT